MHYIYCQHDVKDAPWYSVTANKRGFKSIYLLSVSYKFTHMSVAFVGHQAMEKTRSMKKK